MLTNTMLVPSTAEKICMITVANIKTINLYHVAFSCAIISIDIPSVL